MSSPLVAPTLWPPNVTPERALTPGAVSRCSVPEPLVPGMARRTVIARAGSLLITATRTCPSRPMVAQTLTAVEGGPETASSREPGGRGGGEGE